MSVRHVVVSNWMDGWIDVATTRSMAFVGSFLHGTGLTGVIAGVRRSGIRRLPRQPSQPAGPCKEDLLPNVANVIMCKEDLLPNVANVRICGYRNTGTRRCYAPVADDAQSQRRSAAAGSKRRAVAATPRHAAATAATSEQQHQNSGTFDTLF
eukprot:359683-Chlamydomonas_euryale.AAC.7